MAQWYIVVGIAAIGIDVKVVPVESEIIPRMRGSVPAVPDHEHDKELPTPPIPPFRFHFHPIALGSGILRGDFTVSSHGDVCGDTQRLYGSGGPPPVFPHPPPPHLLHRKVGG